MFLADKETSNDDDERKFHVELDCIAGKKRVHAKSLWIQFLIPLFIVQVDKFCNCACTGFC